MIVLQNHRPRGNSRLLAHALREGDATLCRALLQTAQRLLVLDGRATEVGDQHLLRQIVLRRAKTARGDDAVSARIRHIECGAQTLGIVPDHRLIVGIQPHVREFLRDVLCVRVYDISHEQLRAHADDFYDHVLAPLTIFPLIISVSIHSTTKIPPRKGNSPFFVEITKESLIK